ncbi:Glycosyl phosphatidyl inositol anchor synthesis [Thelotrema lepadinum]|nr:Glycosyl phosphatidyl inositol anchor synthesis [Thelotrema lepadinum]
MARINRFTFVAIAVVFHLVYIASIFDIYFVSPIVHGMRAFPVPRRAGAEAPAKRLVLYVGDGLRADKAFQSFPDPSPPNPNAPEALEPRPLMPFIRSKVEREGTFGVSHTRMPTESRPGHVAMIAGLYEDVSAVTTGWKLNPVNFDSVFNKSRHTWSWGSPDILLMFKEGAVPGRIYADTYSEEAEDFTVDATHLDTWVFEKVEELFKKAATDPGLDADLRKDKNVFFLHLLGLDTTGHSYRPYSKEYLHNIKVVDRGVAKITKMIDDFYNDGKTAYVFTADHGMSDWGSHGDGHPDNTRTPLIAWGSGVRKPRITRGQLAPGHEDGFSHDWGFDRIARHDVNQADVAPLMSYLAGLEFPVNSVGELPLAYINARPEEQAEATLANAQEILEIYRVKEEEKRSTELRYRPYAAFGDEETSIESRLEAIRSLIDEREYEAAIGRSQALMQLGLEGLRYLQTYDWLFLRALVTVGYLGWMAFAMTTVIDLHVLHGKIETSRSNTTVGFAASILVGLYSMLIVQKSPLFYYAYVTMPVIFWEEVIARRHALLAARHSLLGHIKTKMDVFLLIVKTVGFICFLQSLVISYFYREMYSAIYIAAILWPLFYDKSFIMANKLLIANWAIGCVLMSTFTLLPANKIEDPNMVLLGGFLMLCVGVFYLMYEEQLTSANSKATSAPIALEWSRIIIGVQSGLILLAMAVTRSSITSLQAKKGLPLGNQIVGWIVLVLSLSLPFLHRKYPKTHYVHRLAIIFLTFSPLFVILTISYEGMFYLSFCITLVAWVRLEHHIYTFQTRQEPSPAEPLPQPKPLNEAISSAAKQIQSPNEGADHHEYRSLRLSDTRIALWFFFFLQSAFFSQGNIASISSFSLDSVYRLIPIFSPFSQGALLMFKIMIPFALISAVLGILNRRLGVAPSALFMLVMAVSDVLTLNFFWLVRDEGSWLDIGTSISNFSIASMLCAFVASLEIVSEVFVSGVDIEDDAPKNTATTTANGATNAPHANGKILPTRGEEANQPG